MLSSGDRVELTYYTNMLKTPKTTATTEDCIITVNKTSIEFVSRERPLNFRAIKEIKLLKSEDS